VFQNFLSNAKMRLRAALRVLTKRFDPIVSVSCSFSCSRTETLHINDFHASARHVTFENYCVWHEMSARGNNCESAGRKAATKRDEGENWKDENEKPKTKNRRRKRQKRSRNCAAPKLPTLRRRCTVASDIMVIIYVVIASSGRADSCTYD